MEGGYNEAMRSSIHQVGVIVAALATVTATLTATASAPAYGDSVSGRDGVDAEAPAGADIVSHWARFRSDRLDVWVRVNTPYKERLESRFGASDISAFPNDLTVLVGISTDGDDEPEAVVVLYRRTPEEWNVIADTYVGDSDTPCSSIDTSKQPAAVAGTTYVVPVPLGCIGQPTSVRYAVATYYDDGANEPFVDDAPDDRSMVPVVRGATTGLGYWLLGRDGGVFSFGEARFHGSTGNMTLNQPVVAIAAHPDGRGYWLVASDGGVFAFGSAGFHGSTGNIRLNQPIVGMAPTPTGRGYWLVARDGGIFTFGDAAFYGSTGNLQLNQPIVGMAASPSGFGYWLVAGDGGVFTFGDAAFLGSTASGPNSSVGIVAEHSGDGYRIVSPAGSMFGFGDVRYVNSAWPGAPVIVGAASGHDRGLWFAASDGRVFERGETAFGDLRDVALTAPIVGIAAVP